MADQKTVTEATPETPATPEAPVAEVTTIEKSKYDELSTKFSELEKRWQEAETTTRNVESFLQSDATTQERAKLWVQAQKEGKDYSELVKEFEAAKSAKARRESDPVSQPTIDYKKIKELVDEEVRASVTPVFETQAVLTLEKEKAQLFKDEPWLTEELYKEFEIKFGKTIDKLTSEIFASKGPFMTQQERAKAQKDSYDAAQARYAHLSDRELLRIFMNEHRDKFIAEGRRSAPKLPNGMVDNLPTGKAPALITQLKQKYAAIEGDHDAAAKLCEEFAPQLGMSPAQVYKLLD